MRDTGFNGPCEVHHADGTITLVESGQRYVPAGFRHP
jgi:hypothetical protein